MYEGTISSAECGITTPDHGTTDNGPLNYQQERTRVRMYEGTSSISEYGRRTGSREA